MTLGDLIVYNSTIPAGQGTVLQHLSNIQTTREAVCAINVNVTDEIGINIVDDVLLVNYVEDAVTVTIDDTLNVNIIDETLGVSI